MTIKEILSMDKSLLNYIIEVNGEIYDEYIHGNLVHIDTEVEGAYEEYNPTLNITFYRTKVKFTAIEREKVLKLLESEGVDTSLSDYMDKRIIEIAKD